MPSLRAPLMLVAARVRRSPRSWLAPAVAIALTAAFGGAVATESVIVGDRAARSALSNASPLDRVVRLTWQGPLTSAVVRQARRTFAQPGLGPVTQVLLLNQVRLGGVVVRPVAVAPLVRWLAPKGSDDLGDCRPARCRMLLAGGGRVPRVLSAPGVHVDALGAATLRSAVPLGFVPAFSGQGPVLVTGDAGGLDSLPALSGLYRTHNWVAPLQVAALHSWNLNTVTTRLERDQAELSSASAQFTLTAPFTALAAARARASDAPTRLLLIGGGVLVSLLLFVALAAVGLRTEQRKEIDRLRAMGARPHHALVFVVAESGWICAWAVVVGYALTLAIASLLAATAGEPTGAILEHTVASVGFVAAALCLGCTATVLLAAGTLVRGRRPLDALTLAAGTALVVGLALGSGSARTWAGLLVPLGCLSAGLVLLRVMAYGLRLGDRLARRTNVTTRLALLSIARSGGPVAAAIAFLAVSTALAGFALSFRATLVRGIADQAADRVPLDAIVAPGASFVTPLELAPLASWRELSHGDPFPVRRTEATFPAASGSVTIPMLGVPAAAFVRMHGWRTADGSAPLAVLALRLQPRSRFRSPGPELPASARWLRLHVSSPSLNLSVTAELRDLQGRVRPVLLGNARTSHGFVQGALPHGAWELEALEVYESSGLDITDGHQNGENAAAATQFAAPLSLGPLVVSDAHRQPLLTRELGAWRGVGAVSSARGGKPGAGDFAFQTSGFPGVIRPAQPSDGEALPVLADPKTAAAAGRGGRLGVTIDGLPVLARVVGSIERYPTIGQATAGVMVADESALGDALDAQLPGQSRPDEVWISTPRPQAIHAALARGPLAQLSVSFRSEIGRNLRHQPLVVGVLDTLLVAGAATALLAIFGLLVVLGGPFRDRSVERDLEAQGLGRFALRRELRLRLTFAAVLGVLPGIGIAVVIDRLAVGVVGSVESAAPQPPLVTVVPWPQLAALGVAIIALCVTTGHVATASMFASRHARGRARFPAGAVPAPAEDFSP